MQKHQIDRRQKQTKTLFILYLLRQLSVVRMCFVLRTMNVRNSKFVIYYVGTERNKLRAELLIAYIKCYYFEMDTKFDSQLRK